MSKSNDISAFPQADIVDGEGMSLRDYAEVKFVAALLGCNGYSASQPKRVTSAAKILADEWLSRRGGE